MPIHKTDNDLLNGNIEGSPRFRVNKSTALTLTTTFQGIDFNGTSTLNINSFPVVSGQTYKLVDWDAVNKLFKFNSTVDRNYNVQFFYNFSGGIRPVDIFYRFVIPAPTPIYFPFPDGRKYGNLTALERLDDYGDMKDIRIYANSSIRQYGLGLELKSGQTLVTPANLIDAALIIYSN